MAIYDGDYATAPVPIGPLLVERPIPNDQSAFVIRQKYHQIRSNYTRPSTSAAGPVFETLNSYLVDESPLSDTGVGEIVEWTRAWANVPGTRTEAAAVSKNYQQLFTFGGALNLLSFSEVVGVTLYVSYHLGPTGITVHLIPFCMAVPGVPTAYLQKNGFGTDNFGNNYVQVSLNRYMGDIWELREWYG
jgi:hypothetical protein